MASDGDGAVNAAQRLVHAKVEGRKFARSQATSADPPTGPKVSLLASAHTHGVGQDLPVTMGSFREFDPAEKLQSGQGLRL